MTARLLDIEYVEIDVTATVKPAAGGAPGVDKKASKEGGKGDQ